jgi:hypothetical protein
LLVSIGESQRIASKDKFGDDQILNVYIIGNWTMFSPIVTISLLRRVVTCDMSFHPDCGMYHGENCPNDCLWHRSTT